MNRRLLAAAVVLTPTFAFAQAERIQSGLQSFISWLSGIMALICTVGLIFAAMKFQTGDPDARERMKNVAVGAIIGMSAAGLMQLLRGFFA